MQGVSDEAPSMAVWRCTGRPPRRYLIFCEYDTARRATDLVILDAKDIEARRICQRYP